MRKADLAIHHGLVALRQALQHLADRDRIGGGPAFMWQLKRIQSMALTEPSSSHASLSANTAAWRREGQISCRSITDGAEAGLRKQSVVAGRVDVLRREHKNSLPNIRSIVNGIDLKWQKQRNFSDHHPPPSPAPTHQSQSSSPHVSQPSAGPPARPDTPSQSFHRASRTSSHHLNSSPGQSNGARAVESGRS